MSVWGSTDPSGLTGDTSLPEIPPYDPGMSIPGLASSGNTLTIPSAGSSGIPSFSTDAMSADLSGASGGSSNPLAGGGGLGSLLSGGSKIGNVLQQLLGPLFGLNQSGAGGTGGEVGGLAGGALGSIFGPLGTLGGSALGDLLGSLVGNWAGGGLNREAKPNALINTLEASGNPVESELGKYIFNSGTQKGYDLSEPAGTPFNPTREADVLQLLSGEALPKGVTATGFQHDPTLTGWKSLQQLQAMEPNMTELNTNQLQQIRGLIASLVNKSGHESLQGLLGQENTLATKLREAETY